MPIGQEILDIFKNQKTCSAFKNEISRIGNYVKGFQLIESNRFEFFHDTLPLTLVLQVSFHPKLNLVEHLPKEKIFQCFQSTPLDNVPIRILGEVVQ